MKTSFAWALAWGLFLGLSSACVAQEKRSDFVKVLDEATEAIGDPNEFEARVAVLLAHFPQTPTGYYIVDGDILMTDSEVKQMLRDR
jgi:hypothetical protein